MILAPQHLPSAPSNPIRPRPSGESSWELMRHFARLHLASHDATIRVWRTVCRYLVWGGLVASLPFLLVAVLTGNGGLLVSAVTLPFAATAVVGCALRPEVLRYDRKRRPGLLAELRKLEGETPEEV